MPCTGLLRSVACLRFGVLPVIFFKGCYEVEVLRLGMVSQDYLGTLQHNQIMKPVKNFGNINLIKLDY